MYVCALHHRCDAKTVINFSHLLEKINHRQKANDAKNYSVGKSHLNHSHVRETN